MMRYISIDRPLALPLDFWTCYPLHKRPSLSDIQELARVDYIQRTTTSSYSSVTRHCRQQGLTYPTLWSELLACQTTSLFASTSPCLCALGLCKLVTYFSVVRTLLEGVVRVVRARRPTGGAPAISHCCCGRRWRRKGAPSMEKPPVKEQGLWARWKAKAKSLRKQLSERLEERCHNSKSSLPTTPSCNDIGRRHRVPPAGLPIEQVLGEYSIS